MPRCGCAADQCSCYVIAGSNVDVTGSGTRDNPFVVSSATAVVSSTGDSVTTVSGDSHFTGEIIEYTGVDPPTVDYVVCDGRELNRAVYSLLFSRVGTVYGAGNGSTTFNIPNLGGRVTIGVAGAHTRGESGGSETAALSVGNLPPHTHSISHDHTGTGSAGNHDHALQRSTAVGGSNSTIPQGTSTIASTDQGPAVIAAGTHTHGVAAYIGDSGSGSSTGLSSTPVSRMQPYTTVMKMIRIQGGP